MSKSEELSVAEFFRFGMEAASHSASLEMQRQNAMGDSDTTSVERATDCPEDEVS